ncbi:MAG: endonuclease/exonuclease/phosphatase family protein [Planctomycetota bacterium]|jgi:endonuclease/exonuclease/phosphatase family metal-dependent hydrolase
MTKGPSCGVQLAIALAVVVGYQEADDASDEEPSTQVAAHAKVQPHFSAATWNINWGNRDLPQVVEVIRKADADLVALQETTGDSERYLRANLKDRYRYMVFRGDRGRYGAERFGFLSTSPVKGLRFLPARHGLFGAWIGKIELGGRTVQIVNVHLDPIRFLKREGLAGAWRAFRRAQKVHAREIAHVCEKLDPDLPTVILGDLNSLSEMAAPGYLVEQGFVDSFASVTDKPEAHPTWKYPLRLAALAGRIDYIFHTAEFETLQSRILESTASDHWLVLSSLGWAKPERR